MGYKVPNGLDSTSQSLNSTLSSPEFFPAVEGLSVPSQLYEAVVNMDVDIGDRQQSAAGTTNNLSVKDFNTLTNLLNFLKDAPPETHKYFRMLSLGKRPHVPDAENDSKSNPQSTPPTIRDSHYQTDQ